MWLPEVHAADINTFSDTYRRLGKQSEQIVDPHE
jgi:hypothetical protein